MRSQKLFESYPGCPRIPPPIIEPARDAAAMARLGVANVPLARGLVRAAFALSGFARFHATLSGRFDELASGGNRPASPPALINSAVQALADPSEPTDPLRRAACLLAAAWELHAELRAGRFEPDRHDGRPLESRLYPNLFGTCIAFDGAGFSVRKTGNVSRIAVLARRRMYVVDFAHGGVGPPVDAVERALREVVRLSRQERVESPAGALMGLLPCARGHTKARAFRILLEDAGNRAAYELLMDSFATLCLDLELAPDGAAEAAAAAFSGNVGNRWHHSSLQVVVFGNARAALVYSFAAVPSGGTMGRASRELYQRSEAVARAGGALEGGPPAAIQELRWNGRGVPFADAAADARSFLDNQRATFDLTGVGRERLRACGLAPVEAFTAAVQLAGFRLTGRCPTVAQFVSTAGYCCGGVATARVSTREMAALQTELRAAGADPAVVRDLFDKAVESQRTACRRIRTHYPLMSSVRMFRRAQRGMRRRYVEAVFGATWFALRKCRLLEPGRGDDIVLSQPGSHAEVPVIGRPGARVPYCSLFALHYDILGDRIRITIMPALSWMVPSEELAAEIETALTTLCSRVGAAPGQQVSQPA